MPADQETSIFSILRKAGSMQDTQLLIETMLSIQTQLSEIKDNQRSIMKAIRDLRIEQRNRLSDLKKSTQSTLHSSHDALVDRLTEIQDSVDEQSSLDDIDIDLDLPPKGRTSLF
ncbi:MAG: hypothetical protein IIY06_00635 [Proteobacteria bacterium]|jgi:hypothetical protein|nr:hypothetical protein [Pseudomonadota bacterium]